MPPSPPGHAASPDLDTDSLQHAAAVAAHLQQQIAAAGGGILNTVRAVRAASVLAAGEWSRCVCVHMIAQTCSSPMAACPGRAGKFHRRSI